MALIDTLNIYYSGGTSNSDPLLSVGGSIGALFPKLSTISNTNPISGIFIEDSSNIDGSIDLVFTAATRQFKFTVNGVDSNLVNLSATLNLSSFRKAIDLGEDRVLYFRHEGASLPVVDTNVSINITVPSQNVLFPNVDPQQSLLGLIDYRLLYIRNDDPTNSVLLTKIFYRSGNIDVSAYRISASVQTAVNEAPLPSDVSDPSTIVPAFTSTQVLPSETMAPGDTYYFWFRRTIIGLNTISNPHESGYFELTASY